jgi:hypothetical protein
MRAVVCCKVRFGTVRNRYGTVHSIQRGSGGGIRSEATGKNCTNAFRAARPLRFQHIFLDHGCSRQKLRSLLGLKGFRMI